MRQLKKINWKTFWILSGVTISYLLNIGYNYRLCFDFTFKEYADSLRDSGVHGALLVLDQSFGADELAQALGIHSSKNIIRRHLTSELLSVLVPAR